MCVYVCVGGNGGGGSVGGVSACSCVVCSVVFYAWYRACRRACLPCGVVFSECV